MKIREGSFYDWISLVTTQVNYIIKNRMLQKEIEFDSGAYYSFTCFVENDGLGPINFIDNRYMCNQRENYFTVSIESSDNCHKCTFESLDNTKNWMEKRIAQIPLFCSRCKLFMQ